MRKERSCEEHLFKQFQDEKINVILI